LLPGLHSLVDVAGWASPAGLSYLAEQLGLRPAEVWGVATFYDLVPTAADEAYTERRCGDVICGSIHGTGPDVGDSAAVGGAGAVVGAGGAGSSSCLGQCDAGAAVLQKVPGTPYAVQRGASGSAAPTRCGAFDAQSAPAGGRVLARVLARGSVTSFDDYLGAGGGAGLVAAVHRGAEATIAEIEAAGLRGRGGAAFPRRRSSEAFAPTWVPQVRGGQRR
jgi:NADH-quinone oxidoreductase subunit F